MVESEREPLEGRPRAQVDLAVEIWSLFNQLESRIESLLISDYRTINAGYRLSEARMWLENLESDEWNIREREEDCD